MTLTAAITRHRAALAAELSMPMTSRAVPSQTETVEGSEVVDSGPLGGMPFSVPFARYLDTQYGAAFPYSAALKALRHACRHHLGHTDRPEWTGALCHRLVTSVVYWSMDPADAAREVGINRLAAERLLVSSLRLIEQHLSARQAPPSERAEPDEYSPSRLSRAICEAVNREVRDFDLEQRIWESMRHRDPTLRSWEDEWAARQARIIEHRVSCERCRLEEAA